MYDPIMGILELTSSYSDNKGNRVVSEDTSFPPIRFVFHGSGNVVMLKKGAKLTNKSIVRFTGNNGSFSLGSNSLSTATLGVRIGSGSSVEIGENLTTTSRCLITSSEGARVSFGADVMIAAGVQVRSDDAHPIYDRTTNERLNPSQHISIGNHVWLGFDSIVMGGAVIGDHSVVGIRTLVLGQFEPNLVLVGSPARPVRDNITWSRKTLSSFPVNTNLRDSL